MNIQCGMCGDPIVVTKDTKLPHLNEGAICVPCQDYTLGYIYPEPVMAQREVNCSCGMPDCETTKGAWR